MTDNLDKFLIINISRILIIKYQHIKIKRKKKLPFERFLGLQILLDFLPLIN